MRPRLPLFLALAAALAAGGGYLLDRHWKQRHHDAASQSHAAERRLEACLVGNGPLPRSPDVLAQRVRRVALAPATSAAWPGDCEAHVRAMLAVLHATPRPDAAMRAVESRATALASALGRDGVAPAVRAFRAGDSDRDVAVWAPSLRALHDAVTELARAYGGTEPVAAERRASPVLPAVNGDVLPVSLDPGSLVIGTSYAGGTFSVLFIEPTRERVFCRTRDRGVSMRCRRYAPDDAAPRYLVGHDAPEALMLYDHGAATTVGRYYVASVDAPATALFTLDLAPTSSLPLRAVGDTLHAVLDDAGASTLSRCTRGGSCVRFASGAASQQESAVVSSSGRAWWAGVVRSPTGASLDARSLSADAAPPGDAVHLAPLRSGAALMGSCHAEGAAYVVAVDGAVAHLAAFVGDHAPRVLDANVQVGLPFELSCDERGVTVSGESMVQSCARDGACSPAVRIDGVRRFARVAGELVMVSVTRDGGGGLRVRHATPERFAEARGYAVDDDASHGGLSARAAWVFAAGDHLVLFAAGTTTAVLWSDDRGERWAPTREAYEETGHVMAIGTVTR